MRIHQPLLRAAMAVLQAAGGEMNIVLLNKMLFYWDLHSLLETGKSVTGATYVALRQGPVVAKYDKRLVDALVKAGLVEQLAKGTSKPIRVKKSIDAELSAQEKALLDETFALAKKHDLRTSTQASEYSHQNPGWQIAWAAAQKPNGRPQPQPIDMHIAIQQIGGDDAWLKQPLTAEELRQVEADAKGPLEDWN